MPLLQGTRIVLIDNDPDHLYMFQTLLEHYGAEVHTFTGASSAAEAIPGLRPDLVISDLVMPDNGHKLIATIRHLGIPVIALTAAAYKTDQDEALAAGYVRYIVKPVDPEELCKIIAELLGR